MFKVAGTIFALSRLAQTPVRVSLKCEPTLAEQLRGAHPAVIRGYHLNKRRWNTVIVDGSLPDAMIADMVEDSYDLSSASCPVHVAARSPGPVMSDAPVGGRGCSGGAGAPADCAGGLGTRPRSPDGS